MAGFSCVAGLDEAGRGAWAGPVVVAAVVPDLRSGPLLGMDDSKRLKPAEREVLAARIQESGWNVAVGEASAEEIDRLDVLQATRLAAVRAVRNLSVRTDLLLTDALPLPEAGVPVLPLLRGDSWSYAVASASVLAKVERDRRMVELGRRYPQYGFDQHKGYGVPEHRAALSQFGPCPEHRLTFDPVLPRREGRAA